MWLRVVLLVGLPLCYLEGADTALPGAITGFFVDNAKDVGVPLPGYMTLLSSKSNLLTNLMHYIFGNKLEEKFRTVIKKDVQYLPDNAPIEEVNEDNKDKMSFKQGVLVGLKTIGVTPNTDVSIIWSKGLPVLTVSVTFDDLRVKGEIKKPFGWTTGFGVEGVCEIKFVKNNFVLEFRLYPGLFEWCYLKLHDVTCTDLDEMLWDVKDKDGKDDLVSEATMQHYFLSFEGTVENHIKTSIANIIYHEIPKASAAICDNTSKILRHSDYQKFKLDKHTHKKTSADKNSADKNSADKNSADKNSADKNNVAK